MMADEDPLALSFVSAPAIEEEKSTKRRSKKDEAQTLNAATAAAKEERLAGKAKAAAGPSQAPPPPPPPPEVDKSALLDKIMMFREKFPNLKSRNKTSAKSSAEELEDELHYFEQQLGTREGSVGMQCFQLLIAGLEETTTKHYNPLGLRLQGLSAVTNQNQEQFAPIIDELMIKYGASMYVGPEMRLVMALGSLVWTVHAANSGNPALASAMEKMGKKVGVSTDL